MLNCSYVCTLFSYTSFKKLNLLCVVYHLLLGITVSEIYWWWLISSFHVWLIWFPSNAINLSYAGDGALIFHLACEHLILSLLSFCNPVLYLLDIHESHCFYWAFSKCCWFNKFCFPLHCFLVNLNDEFIVSGYIKMPSLDSEASSDMATNSYWLVHKAYRSLDA